MDDPLRWKTTESDVAHIAMILYIGLNFLKDDSRKKPSSKAILPKNNNFRMKC